MASQQPIRFNCKTCGPLDADKFSALQISSLVREEDRRCKDCIEKDAAEKRAAVLLARVQKHSERVAVQFSDGAVVTSVGYKRERDGSIKGAIRRLTIDGQPVRPPLKVSTTRGELVLAGANVDERISDTQVLELCCTSTQYKGAKAFSVNLVLIDGRGSASNPIWVPRFDKITGPVVNVSDLNLQLRDFDAAAQRERGTVESPWLDSGRGHVDLRKAILDRNWPRVLELCRADPYVKKLAYPENCLKRYAHVVKVNLPNVHRHGGLAYGSLGSDTKAYELASLHAAANFLSRAKQNSDVLSELPKDLREAVRLSREGKWMDYKEGAVGKGRLRKFLEQHPPGVDVRLLSDGSVRIRARVDSIGSAKMWQKCDTIDEAATLARRRNAYVRGHAEAIEDRDALLVRLAQGEDPFAETTTGASLLDATGHGGRSDATVALTRVEESLVHVSVAMRLDAGLPNFTAYAPGAFHAHDVFGIGWPAASKKSLDLAPLVTEGYDLAVSRVGVAPSVETFGDALDQAMYDREVDVALWASIGYDISGCRNVVRAWWGYASLVPGVYTREALFYAPRPVIYAGTRESHVYSAYAKDFCKFAAISLRAAYEAYSVARGRYERMRRAGREADVPDEVRALLSGARDAYEREQAD